jgi:hypothetical protein
MGKWQASLCTNDDDDDDDADCCFLDCGEWTKRAPFPFPLLAARFRFCLPSLNDTSSSIHPTTTSYLSATTQSFEDVSSAAKFLVRIPSPTLGAQYDVFV